jgi:hypothetical protein
MAVDAERLRGREDPGTSREWADLVLSYQSSGRAGEAVHVLQAVAEAPPGGLVLYTPTPSPPGSTLLPAIGRTGRTPDAIVILKAVVADTEPLFGRDDPGTLRAKGLLSPIG